MLLLRLLLLLLLLRLLLCRLLLVRLLLRLSLGLLLRRQVCQMHARNLEHFSRRGSPLKIQL